jgi:hypothetical protein
MKTDAAPDASSSSSPKLVGKARARSRPAAPSCDNGNLMTRIDPTSNMAVASVDMGGIGNGPAIINGSAWIAVHKVSAAAADRIVRIGTDTSGIDRIVQPTVVFGGGGGYLAVAAGSVWVTDGFDNRVLRLPMSAFAR